MSAFTLRIFKTTWGLKKNGRPEATSRGVSKKLEKLSDETSGIRW
jgi:hypothetical protein